MVKVPYKPLSTEITPVEENPINTTITPVMEKPIETMDIQEYLSANSLKNKQVTTADIRKAMSVSIANNSLASTALTATGVLAASKVGAPLAVATAALVGGSYGYSVLGSLLKSSDNTKFWIDYSRIKSRHCC